MLTGVISSMMANANFRKRKKLNRFPQTTISTSFNINFIILCAFVIIHLVQASDVCSISQFQCGPSLKCIPLSQRCDGYVDCFDKSDEINCPKKNCTGFLCANGMCIHDDWVCDGHDDCRDNSDEANCEQTCKAYEFKCYHGGCVAKNRVCDGTFDCDDLSDETTLACLFHVNECTKKEFSCDNGHCIDTAQVCNGKNDCGDNSDERLPHCVQCFSNEFRCSGGTCVPQDKVCDGENDCPGGEDENNCVKQVLCSGDDFMCHNKLECIHKKWICDGSNDCTDRSDEWNCLNNCDLNQFQCANNHCIPLSMKCNGSPECVDGSDEVNCVNVTELTTPPTCFEGFRWSEDSGGCQDDDECVQDYSICSGHECVNTEGSFECRCHQGYQLHNSRMCISNESVHTLLYSTPNRLQMLKWSMNPDTLVSQIHGEFEYFQDQNFQMTFDYNIEANYLVASNQLGQFYIRRLFNDHPVGINIATPGVFVPRDTNVKSMSIDWINHLIFYINQHRNQIEVLKLTKLPTLYTLVTDVVHGQSIKINPIDGWLIWSESGDKAKIEKSTLDGSIREVLVWQDIVEPRGITIDYVTRRIYWLDAKMYSINSIEFDGNNRQLVLQTQIYLGNPFDLTLFDDVVIWSDFDSNAIYSANKFGLSNVVNTIVDSIQSKTLTTVDRKRQPQSSQMQYCSECAFLCDNKHRCQCPIDYQLVDNNCIHINNTKHGPEATIFDNYIYHIFCIIVLVIIVAFIIPYAWKYVFIAFKQKFASNNHLPTFKVNSQTINARSKCNYRFIKLNGLRASSSAVSTDTTTTTILAANKSTDHLTTERPEENSSGYSSISDQASIKQVHVNMANDDDDGSDNVDSVLSQEKCKFIV